MGTEEQRAWAAKLVRRLLSSGREDEIREFKHNNADPEPIGEYISALANSAAILGVGNAYVVWGIEDVTKRIVGTDFDPWSQKVRGEELPNWLIRGLEPQVGIRFTETGVDGQRLVVLEVPAATHRPIQFHGTEWVRIGSYKKKLTQYPEEARRLWRAFESGRFERNVSAGPLGVDDVFNLLDHDAYFRLLGLPIPKRRDQVVDALVTDGLVRVNEVDEWDVTNLGALLFARDFGQFPGLARKAVRVIVYEGTDRRNTVREQAGQYGYAAGFEGLVRWVNGQLPGNEHIGQALRRDVRVYPDVAIRELVANALIHQDLTITGAGPMVEIFADRLEITNPDGRSSTPSGSLTTRRVRATRPWRPLCVD